MSTDGPRIKVTRRELRELNRSPCSPTFRGDSQVVVWRTPTPPRLIPLASPPFEAEREIFESPVVSTPQQPPPTALEPGFVPNAEYPNLRFVTLSEYLKSKKK